MPMSMQMHPAVACTAPDSRTIIPDYAQLYYAVIANPWSISQIHVSYHSRCPLEWSFLIRNSSDSQMFTVGRFEARLTMTRFVIHCHVV